MKKILILLAICLLPITANAADPAPAAAKAKPEAAPAAAAPAPPATSTATPTVSQQAPLSLLQPTPQPAQKIVQVKIGAVDIGRISMESEMGKAAQAKIKALQAKLQKQIEGKKKQVEKFKADIEKQMPTLAPPQREAKAKEFQKKVEEFQKFGMGAEKELMSTQERFTKELLGAVEKASNEFGSATKMTAIVVKRELIYVAEGVEALDITDALIKIINDKAAKADKK